MLFRLSLLFFALALQLGIGLASLLRQLTLVFDRLSLLLDEFTLLFCCQALLFEVLSLLLRGLLHLLFFSWLMRLVSLNLFGLRLDGLGCGLLQVQQLCLELFDFDDRFFQQFIFAGHLGIKLFFCNAELLLELLSNGVTFLDDLLHLFFCLLECLHLDLEL